MKGKKQNKTKPETTQKSPLVDQKAKEQGQGAAWRPFHTRGGARCPERRLRGLEGPRGAANPARRGRDGDARVKLGQVPPRSVTSTPSGALTSNLPTSRKWRWAARRGVSGSGAHGPGGGVWGGAGRGGCHWSEEKPGEERPGTQVSYGGVA